MKSQWLGKEDISKRSNQGDKGNTEKLERSDRRSCSLVNHSLDPLQSWAFWKNGELSEFLFGIYQKFMLETRVEKVLWSDETH